MELEGLGIHSHDSLSVPDSDPCDSPPHNPEESLLENTFAQEKAKFKSLENGSRERNFGDRKNLFTTGKARRRRAYSQYVSRAKRDITNRYITNSLT